MLMTIMVMFSNLDKECIMYLKGHASMFVYQDVVDWFRMWLNGSPGKRVLQNN